MLNHFPSSRVNIMKIPARSTASLKLLLCIITLSIATVSYAELEELDDQALLEQTGQKGMTIDIAFKLSIGEIYIDYLDRDQDNNQNTLLNSPPPRIEYHTSKN